MPRPASERRLSTKEERKAGRSRLRLRVACPVNPSHAPEEPRNKPLVTWFLPGAWAGVWAGRGSQQVPFKQLGRAGS